MFVACIFVPPSNESGSSGDYCYYFQYTNVTGTNQSGSSWDRPPAPNSVRCVLSQLHSQDRIHYLDIVLEYPEYYNKTCTSCS